MRCAYCGSENTYETSWRRATYLCRECGRQFRNFEGNEGALLNVNRLPSVVSRADGDRQLVSVYVPKGLLATLNKTLTGKPNGRSIARSPFIVAGIILLMGVVWGEHLGAANDLLRDLSKSRKTTAIRLRQLADMLDLED